MHLLKIHQNWINIDDQNANKIPKIKSACDNNLQNSKLSHLNC